LGRWLPGRLARTILARPLDSPESLTRNRITAGVAILILVVSGFQMFGTFAGRLPRPVRIAMSWMAPFRIVNPYGLFAVMTTSRPEIIVEGSNDGRTWLAYEFKYKPGDVTRPPGWVAPYQPRLDWQMWFAAWGTCDSNPWFENFLLR